MGSRVSTVLTCTEMCVRGAYPAQLTPHTRRPSGHTTTSTGHERVQFASLQVSEHIPVEHSTAQSALQRTLHRPSRHATDIGSSRPTTQVSRGAKHCLRASAVRPQRVPSPQSGGSGRGVSSRRPTLQSPLHAAEHAAGVIALGHKSQSFPKHGRVGPPSWVSVAPSKTFTVSPVVASAIVTSMIAASLDVDGKELDVRGRAADEHHTTDKSGSNHGERLERSGAGSVCSVVDKRERGRGSRGNVTESPQTPPFMKLFMCLAKRCPRLPCRTEAPRGIRAPPSL